MRQNLRRKEQRNHDRLGPMFSIQEFESLDSTNKYCELLNLQKVEEFTVIWAHSQPQGIGQRGNSWESEPKKNLTFSLILKPDFIQVKDQFLLTKAISLALLDWGESIGIQASIKWPNDIYVGNKKLCGILISNHTKGNFLSSSICGIGININQRIFPQWVPNPTSTFLESHQELDLQETLQSILSHILSRYHQLQSLSLEDLHRDYLSHLMGYNSVRNYYYQAHTIQAQITGVNPFGHLILHTPEGNELVCQMKEISWLFE